MKKCLLLFLLSAFVFNEAEAQFTRYVVKLKNKGGTTGTFTNPLAYLSQRAIDRRTRYGIAIDSTDLPVSLTYLNQVKAVANVTVLNVSKWLNSISIQTSDANAITTINGFAFVQSVNSIAAKPVGIEPAGKNKFELENIERELPQLQNTQRLTADFFNYGTNSYNEIHLHNGEFLHNIGLRGQGMVISMLDGGFFNYLTLDAMDSAVANGQILSTWDFVARHASVVEDNSHGMQCLSTIVANIPGQFIGKAPKAAFHLFRTEDVATEYPIEEHNWVCGAERADSSGSDIISSSLGYADQMSNAVFNHTYADMNGNTLMCSIAADLAAKKGILVFNANGNEGGSSWNFLISPADGDSVVAVGAVNSAGAVGGFSSYGPSSDGQIKPDLASVGVSALIQGTGNTVVAGNGTSFACPNMAGLGTCLWQAFPEFNNMKILKAMQQAGTRASNPDDRVGYGIPNMKTAFANLLKDFATSSATVNACNATINWTSKDVRAMHYIIERKLPGEVNYTPVGQLPPATGDILAIHNYQFNNVIISPTPGTVSYRIGQVIDTALATLTLVYIDTANVTITSGCFATGTGNVDPDKVAVTVQPNPVSGTTLTLIIETPYAVTNMPIGVYDSKGRLMIQVNSSKGTGKKTIDLDIQRLATGKYYIKVLNGVKTIGTAELLKL
ncbi:MAG: S8 family serine peptidase [Chitinophagaceae bacterium]|nr:S8 family serine peptidase [Chitinophagaceae bacterium]